MPATTNEKWFPVAGNNHIRNPNVPGGLSQIDNKTLQWFGATVSASLKDGGPILVSKSIKLLSSTLAMFFGSIKEAYVDITRTDTFELFVNLRAFEIWLLKSLDYLTSKYISLYKMLLKFSFLCWKGVYKGIKAVVTNRRGGLVRNYRRARS